MHTPKPVARDLGRRVGHRLLRTAGGSTRFASARCLNWRTRHGAVGAEHATITRLWLQLRAATGALVKELTGIGRHLLCLGRGTVWTGDHGFTDHGIPVAYARCLRLRSDSSSHSMVTDRDSEQTGTIGRDGCARFAASTDMTFSSFWRSSAQLAATAFICQDFSVWWLRSRGQRARGFLFLRASRGQIVAISP